VPVLLDEKPHKIPKAIERDNADEDYSMLVSRYKMAEGNLGLRKGQQVHEIHMSQIKSAIDAVLHVESPIHVDELMRRVIEAAGYNKVGNRIRTHLFRAIKSSARDGRVYLERDFVYIDKGKTAVVRDRSDLAPGQRKIEFVSLEERSEAVLMVVKNAFTITKEEAMAEALYLFGIKRLTKNAHALMNEAVVHLLKIEALGQKGDLIFLPTN